MTKTKLNNDQVKFPAPILFSKKKDAFIEIILQEFEIDRASGAEVQVHIKRKNLNAKFFHLWIEKTTLSGFIGNIKQMITGKVNTTTLNSPDNDDLYMILTKRNQSYFIGVKVMAYNFTPTKLKDSVSISFEIDQETIGPFIKELEEILVKL